MGNSIAFDKSKAFALRIVRLYQHLCDEKKEYILSKQVLRCGTSIGANIREAQHAQSRKDFASKMNIALKEAGETEYWLDLLYEANYIDQSAFESIYADCAEINRLLISIVKTSNSSK